MDEVIPKLKWLAAAVAAVVLVLTMFWFVFNRGADDVVADETIQYDNVTTFEVCHALGGRKKTSSGKSVIDLTQTSDRGTMPAGTTCAAP